MTEKMKPSGIAWIGDVPQSWKTKKIKYYMEIVNGSTPDSSDFNCWDGPIKWITPADMDNTGIISEGERTLTQYGYNSCGTTLLPTGSVVISSRAPIGKINITGNVLCTNQGCKSLVGETDNRYLYYLLLAGQEELVRLGRGTTFIELSTFDLANFGIVLPQETEQCAIADFLDAQCAKIDSVIADIEKQIETLQKYKKSLITETVTKGLDSSVPMKDSGVDWVGKIPAHWSVKRLKYVMNNFDSQRKPIEAQNRSQDGDVLYDYYGASGAIDKIDDYIFDETALLIGEDGANLVLRHLPLIYIATGKYWVNNHAHILRPKAESDLYFMAHQMEIIDYSLFITGSAQPKLSQENLNNVMLVVPPLEEQLEIATFLNQKVTVIDEIIGNKQKQLDAIRQHKKSLIYEYVTGKKRVAEVN